MQRNGVNPELHLKGIKKLNYTATRKQLEEKGVRTAKKYEYDKLIAYKQEYTDMYNNRFRNQINGYIEEAYKFRAKDLGKSVKAAKNAAWLAEAVTLMLPENEEAKKLKADADKTLEDIGGEYYSQIYTSDFHKQNTGKILFSKEPIVIGEERPDQFTTDFTAKDKIYAIAYLDERIRLELNHRKIQRL